MSVTCQRMPMSGSAVPWALQRTTPVAGEPRARLSGDELAGPANQGRMPGIDREPEPGRSLLALRVEEGHGASIVSPHSSNTRCP